MYKPGELIIKKMELVFHGAELSYGSVPKQEEKSERLSYKKFPIRDSVYVFFFFNTRLLIIG